MIDQETGEIMEDKSELFAALAIAQGQFKPVGTDKSVSFPTSKGSVKYNYASFAAIVKMAQGPLSQNGLAIFQTTLDDHLITTLAHKSGQSITSVIPLPSEYNDIKQLGANLSYLRRYQYTAIAGIVIQDEDDENAVEGPVKQPTKKTTPKPTNGNKPKSEQPADPWPAKDGHVAEFCKAVREKTDYYNAQMHLYNAIGGWGNLSNPDEFQAKLSAALDHAKEKQAA